MTIFIPDVDDGIEKANTSDVWCTSCGVCDGCKCKKYSYVSIWD